MHVFLLNGFGLSKNAIAYPTPSLLVSIGFIVHVLLGFYLLGYDSDHLNGIYRSGVVWD
jgi:hypothetical protein